MIDKYNEVGISPMENVGQGRAKPMSGCIYPRCEECDKYHGHYCTVPMVVSKQIWLTTESLIARMEKRITELENLVTDEILGSKREEPKDPDKELNYTWADYFGDADKEQEDG